MKTFFGLQVCLCASVVLLGLVNADLSPEAIAEMKAKNEKFAAGCIPETGVGQDDIALLMQKKSPSTREGKCFLFCMHKKIGFQNDAGQIDKPRVDEWLTSAKSLDADFGNAMERVAKACCEKINDNGDGCDVAELIFDCCMEKAKEEGVNMEL